MAINTVGNNYLGNKLNLQGYLNQIQDKIKEIRDASKNIVNMYEPYFESLNG